MKSVNLLLPVSAATNLTSGVFDLLDLAYCSVQAEFSGGASNLVGSLALQGSNDNSIYVTLTNGTQAVAASESHVWDVVTSMRYLKVVWTFTSGTGNLRVDLIAKEPLVK